MAGAARRPARTASSDSEAAAFTLELNRRIEQTRWSPAGVSVVCFLLAGGRYGLPAERVAGIFLPGRVRELPMMPPWFSGLVDFRGEALPVYDLRALVGPDRTPAARLAGLPAPMVAAIGSQGMRFAFRTAGIEGLLTVGGTENEAGGKGPFVAGVTVGPEGGVRVIDADAVLAYGRSELARLARHTYESQPG